MTDGTGNERERQVIADEAAEWFVANREPLDAARRAAFGEWLRRSTRHEEEYLALMRVARRVQRARGQSPSVEALLADARSEEATKEATNVTPMAAERRARRAPFLRQPWLYAAVAAGVACLALLMFWGRGNPPAPQTAWAPGDRYSTLHGQQLTKVLADGSVLHLNTDSVVYVRYEQSLRRVMIERGQVMFNVAHDPARPFRVIAGSAQVVAVGTEFDVYLKDRVTLVTVVEGRVAVAPVASEGSTATLREPIQVAAGEQVRVVRGELPTQPSAVDTRNVTAWLNRKIAFEHETLSVVAAEFNRYSATPIVIESPELRTLAVSGVFNVDDTESFVAFLHSQKGVGVDVTPTEIRVFKP